MSLAAGPHLCHSLRSLRRAPAPAAVSVVTIALGVAAATLLFGVVKAVLLNPLPYPAAERLTWIASITSDAEGRRSIAALRED
jgi:hypothetical protein